MKQNTKKEVLIDIKKYEKRDFNQWKKKMKKEVLSNGKKYEKRGLIKKKFINGKRGQKRFKGKKKGDKKVF